MRKERVWIGRAIRRDRRSANWLSPITFIHLKSTRPPLPLAPAPASFPPFFIPFRVHHAPATFTIAPRSNSTSPGGRESKPPKLDNSPPAERPFFERPCSLSLGRFLKIKSRGKPANGNHLSEMVRYRARPVKIRTVAHRFSKKIYNCVYFLNTGCKNVVDIASLFSNLSKFVRTFRKPPMFHASNKRMDTREYIFYSFAHPSLWNHSDGIDLPIFRRRIEQVARHPIRNPV